MGSPRGGWVALLAEKFDEMEERCAAPKAKGARGRAESLNVSRYFLQVTRTTASDCEQTMVAGEQLFVSGFSADQSLAA